MVRTQVQSCDWDRQMRRLPLPSMSSASASSVSASCVRVLPSEGEATQHVAFLALDFASHRKILECTDADGEEWLTACYRLTPRVERAAHGLFLDLGICTNSEARAVL